MISTSITKLQTAMRCWLLRKRFLKQRAAAVTVQAWVRGERTRATVGREMAELVRKRKEKEAQEAEAQRIAEEERRKQMEEQALSVRLGKVCRMLGLGAPRPPFQGGVSRDTATAARLWLDLSSGLSSTF